MAASLSALVVFPLSFLRSFAYAGIGVVTLAAVASVVVLPAALAVIGTRIDRWTLFRRHPQEVGEGFWHRLAVAVMARPLPIAAAVVAVLLVLGLPFFGVELGLPDDRALPKEASSRQVHDRIRAEFSSKEAGVASVVATGKAAIIGRLPLAGGLIARSPSPCSSCSGASWSRSRPWCSTCSA